MSDPRPLTRRLLLAALAAALAVTAAVSVLNRNTAEAAVTLPPAHANFDYQIGAHSKNLAIGQKNTVELAGDRDAVGLDFAVAEECGEWDECGDHVDAFGNNVIVIEYTDGGMDTACSGFADTLSIVQRDVDASVPGDSGYVRKTC